jgi:hypothetical protein
MTYHRIDIDDHYDDYEDYDDFEDEDSDFYYDDYDLDIVVPQRVEIIGATAMADIVKRRKHAAESTFMKRYRASGYSKDVMREKYGYKLEGNPIGRAIRTLRKTNYKTNAFKSE